MGQTLFEYIEATAIFYNLSECVGHIEVKIWPLKISRETIFGRNKFIEGE